MYATAAFDNAIECAAANTPPTAARAMPVLNIIDPASLAVAMCLTASQMQVPCSFGHVVPASKASLLAAGNGVTLSP